ncbi:MAG: polymer-forming cytoskeletal protein [Bacteroidales bacterium]|nr:polymer-forming cytoskeletal protein [Bacteroidales bacterium]
MARNEITEQGAVNTITRGTVIKGNITASGDFRMDGDLQGNITLNGKLVVGESGKVVGNVVCQNANIIGTVLGNITVKELLSLHSTASVKGDIMINKLSIEPGASFSGTCRMLDEVRQDEKTAEKSSTPETGAHQDQVGGNRPR